LKQLSDKEAWHGPRPLPNPLDVARLGEIYSRTAAFYDGIVAEKQAAPKLEALRQLARRPGERFLEVGVGTAWAFQRIIADSGPESAYGIDVALGMLEVARRRLTELQTSSQAAPAERPPPESRPSPSGPGSMPPTSLLLADARALPFPGAAFDCLLNTYTFEVLATPDIPPVLDECLRVLRPGGRLAVVNLTEGQGDDAAMIDDWKRRYAEDPEFFGGARPLQLQPMLRARGFTNVTRTYVGPDWPSEVLLAFRPA
jgi:ubiquinone/menaquinone biosynthesis C-methylase UbiE